MAYRAQIRGRRPRVSTRVDRNACVGCHVAWGVGIWRAHGLVGPGESIGAVTQRRYRSPIFNCVIRLVLFRVGLCSHKITLLQVTWRHHKR